MFDVSDRLIVYIRDQYWVDSCLSLCLRSWKSSFELAYHGNYCKETIDLECSNREKAPREDKMVEIGNEKKI